MNIGDKVLIKTSYGGMYNRKTGVIVPPTIGMPEGFIRVEFDEPIRIESRVFKGDIFLPRELTVL